MKCFLIFACAVVTTTVTTEEANYSDSYVANYIGEENELDNLLFDYGYSVDKKILPHYFKVRRNERIRTVKKEISFNNLKLDDKRHPEHSPAMEVYNAWIKGYSGSGIIIAIVDDGIDTNHTDLAGNYNSSLSTNIIGKTDDPSHIWSSEGHGTKCAGIAGSVQNNDCVVGIAYDATLAAIRLLDDRIQATASDEASALIFNLDSVDIYSNSWGPVDDGVGFDMSDKLNSLQNEALISGVTNGRGGKGAIYVWAAGNGGDVTDDCNVDGYSSSMYTISISSVRPDGSRAWYAEECTAIMAVTYGGDEYYDQIATTYTNGKCIDDFQGTSAACPMAAGIIALVLQANSQLSWRDIQHLVVESATSISIPNANFYTNSAGKRVSLSHGFGLMNATYMVDLASSWQTVPKRIHCNITALNKTSSSSGTDSINVNYRVDNCFIGNLEHVMLTLVYRVLWREYTSIYLVSPLGTESRVLRERKQDTKTTVVDWTFMSLHTWGENPAGTWQIRFKSTKPENKMILYSWKLDLYGTVTDSLMGIPADGKTGGFCNETIQCEGPDPFCLMPDNVCMNCSAGFHIIDESCIADGTESGFCNESVVCFNDNNGCNSSSSRCVVCGTGYHVKDSFCLADGMIGGYCDNVIHCENNTDHLACNETSNTCIHCDSGYHAIDGFCKQDGTFGGYCNSTVHCAEASVRCDANICVNCTAGYHVINNTCKQDGRLGGYCGSVLCSDAGSGCDKSTFQCVQCSSDHHAIQGFCIKDGVIGGYCNESTQCISGNTQCTSNICEESIVIKDQDSNTKTIVGATLGALICALIIGSAVIVAIMKRGRKKNKIRPKENKVATEPSNSYFFDGSKGMTSYISFIKTHSCENPSQTQSVRSLQNM